MTKIAQFVPEHERGSAVAERNDEKMTKAVRATANAAANATRESVDVARSAVDATEDNIETMRDIAKGSPELGHAFAEAMMDQTRQSADTLSAFARAVNWHEIAQAQNKLIAGSILRFGQFSARYSEFLLRRMTATPASSRR